MDLQAYLLSLTSKGGRGTYKMLGRDMSRVWKELRRVWLLLVLAALLAAATLAPVTPQKAVLATDLSEHPELTITVVETIPAEQIDDEGVPLAAGPGGGSAIEMPQVCLMGAVLICSVSYALYARRCDERLFALRKQVVDAERRLEGTGEDTWM